MMDTENQIDISVETAYLESQSTPAHNQYVFSYTITIQNMGSTPARLLNRHWVITDANGKIEEVRGKGVVGEQPHLRPGEGFCYTSGAVLETTTGCMEGSFEMVNDNDDLFTAEIPAFSLSLPNALH